MEELINKLKGFKAADDSAKEMEETIKEAIEELQYYDVALAIFDEREYRKRYLEERRKEQPNLLYPDADEIYKRYYEQQEQLQEKDKIINIMGEQLAGLTIFDNDIESPLILGDKSEVIEYFTKKAREV